MKTVIEKIVALVLDKDRRFEFNKCYGWISFLNDRTFLKICFKKYMGVSLNLKEPKTFSEKLQWLKLYNRKPEYTMMVDKYLVREYVAETIGEEYLIPILGVWKCADEIDFRELPKQFVLKCNHNSGKGMCICKDKENLDKNSARRMLRRGLRENYYRICREWPYKNVERRIIAEKYMIDEKSGEDGLNDYKLMCFNGKVEYILVCTERFADSGVRLTFFDTNWNKMCFGRKEHPISDAKIEKPLNLKLMIEFAEKFAKEIPFLRVDFYEINGKLYFGELTFFPSSGFEAFNPESWDRVLGDKLSL